MRLTITGHINAASPITRPGASPDLYLPRVRDRSIPGLETNAHRRVILLVSEGLRMVVSRRVHESAELRQVRLGLTVG